MEVDNAIHIMRTHIISKKQIITIFFPYFLRLQAHNLMEFSHFFFIVWDLVGLLFLLFATAAAACAIVVVVI